MRLEQTDARMCASSRRLPTLPSGARLWEKAHRWSEDAGGGRRAKRGGEELSSAARCRGWRGTRPN